jgi:soluble lytic murein transglycosylase-like protein
LPEFPIKSRIIPKNGADMIRKICFAAIFVALAAPAASAKNLRATRLDANGNLDSLIARYAAANNLPEDLLRRVIKRESGGNPRVIYKGNYGLMQIKLATARSMGYRGAAAGLLDADTNMTYAAKYLAGAYQVAGGNSNRAVHYYAAGYYYVAKRKGYTMPSQQTASAAFALAKGSGNKQLIVAQNDGAGASPASDRFGARLDGK